jgi:AraC family transcriptional regulator
MNYYEQVQKAVDYIEENLYEDISLEAIAKEAYCSLFHFHRVFQGLIGDSMKEYIRKRRLSLAGRELATTDTKIIDIALKYGYGTPEAFTKAFKKMNGITPTECRRIKGLFQFRDKACVYVYKALLSKGGLEMNYRIVEKESFKIIGRELRVRNDNGDNNKLIPKFWTSCMEEGIFEQFQSMTNRINPQYIDTMGMCMDFDGINTFLYLICVEATNFDYIPEGMTAKTIPGPKYVVFTAKGRMPEAIQQTWQDIYGKWFPTSGYERTNGPDFEFYDNRSEVNDDNCEVDIYIPIK